MKKFLKKAHLWMALPCGIFISILCLTGGILVFESELIHLLNHDRYYVDKVKDEALPLEKLIPMVHEAYPDWPMEAVQIYSDLNRTYFFDFTTAKNTGMYVDPYTGQIVSVMFPGYDGFSGIDVFFDLVRALHFNLLVSPERGEFAWGSFINGVATLIFFFIIVTGIIIWAPKKVKNIKERLKINVKKGGFRFWYDLHLAGGIFAAIFLLLMVLSGLDFAFDWYHNGVLALFGGGSEGPQVQQVQQGVQPPVEQENLSTDNVEDLQQIGKTCDMLYQQFRRDYPGASIIKFKYGGTSWLTLNKNKPRTQVSFDNATGEIKWIRSPEEHSPEIKAESFIDYLHFGTWAGVFSKIIYVLAALIGASLPITGYYFYFRKKIRKSKSV